MGHLTEGDAGSRLTEIGKEQLDLKKWCDEHPERGELHTPTALILDEHAGWVPPRHLYTRDTYLVWGNMPYSKGDHQVDLLLRELYPGYQDASFYHDERGFLTPTPCGDSLDVILSDATHDVLKRYQCLVVLGQVEFDSQFSGKIKRFLKEGGDVVLCANQLGEEGSRLLGVGVGDPREDYHATLPGTRWPINEPKFRFLQLDLPADSTILSETKRGEPLAASIPGRGGGRVLIFGSEFFLSKEVLPLEHVRNEIDMPLASPYAMLEHAKGILLPHLRSFSLVNVHGPPIQYLVNVDSRTDRLLVTLCNNHPQGWRGRVEPKGGRIEEALNWMSGRKLKAGPNVAVEVPPLDAATVELALGEPAFEVRRG
jgi:hypothetical protein